jgi:hypothetical protein
MHTASSRPRTKRGGHGTHHADSLAAVKLDSEPKPHGKHASLKTSDDGTVQDAQVAWNNSGKVRGKEPQHVADEKL